MKNSSNYPKDLGNNRWVVQVKNSDGSTRDQILVLFSDSLAQMGWDGGKDINIYNILENHHVDLQDKPNLLQGNLESIITN